MGEAVFEAGEAGRGFAEAIVEFAQLLGERVVRVLGEGLRLFEALEAGEGVGEGIIRRRGRHIWLRQGRVCSASLPAMIQQTMSALVIAAGTAAAKAEEPEAAPLIRAEMRFDEPVAEVAPEFGRADTWWWSIGAGAAHDFEDSTDLNVNVAARYFIADDVEFMVEVGLWYYNQPGDDAIGFNPNMVFRWHFVNRPSYSIYADAGIGVVVATDDVPAERDIDGEIVEGTPFGFTPRVGVGASFRLSEDSGARLEIGLRWAHVSNARLSGDDDNPARDSAMLYAGLVFPF